MIRVVLNGILGRMGNELSQAVLAEDDLILIGGVDTLETFYSDEIVVSTNPAEVLVDADVVIDFSSGSGTATIAKFCLNQKIPLITGTTGLSHKQQSEIVALARRVPIVQAASYSIGINLLLNTLENTARALKGDFTAEIVEVQHRDHPGKAGDTALYLAKTLTAAMSTGADDRIGVHSLRGGSTPGEHEIRFFANHENIAISHQALSLKVYAAGALRAAEWVIDQPPGLYSMMDVLELN